jgi:hypothetical protein
LADRNGALRLHEESMVWGTGRKFDGVRALTLRASILLPENRRVVMPDPPTQTERKWGWSLIFNLDKRIQCTRCVYWRTVFVDGCLKVMNPLLLIIILLLLFGGGGFYFGGPVIGGSGLGLILLIVLIVYLMGGLRGR